MILATIILLVFIGGIIIFVLQYYKRKLIYEKEKDALNEQHSKELLESQVAIQKQTMQDIGRDIHDNVGQRLTLASLYLNQLSYTGGYEAGGTDQASSIAAIIDESLSELRSLSKSLTNTDADMEQLVAMLRNECLRVNKLNICRATLRSTAANTRLPATVKIFVLRIIQEFIQNSLKHSGCSEITIDLGFTDSAGLCIIARDNGRGFHTSGQHASAGIGLTNMQQRARLIGAEMSFDSAPGKGTTLQLLIPADKMDNDGH